jgi:hypothetical protein
MKRLAFTFLFLALLPSLAWSDSTQVIMWPQSESFYTSKSATPSRRVVETGVNNGYLMQQPQMQQPIQGYAPLPPAMQSGFPNSPSGILPPMPIGMPQGFPSSLPSFSAPTVTVPSLPNMMPSYGNMPFSPMPGFGSMPFGSNGFPSNGFGNMMPFPGGNSFSGMPFGFGY